VSFQLVERDRLAVRRLTASTRDPLPRALDAVEDVNRPSLREAGLRVLPGPVEG